MPKHNRVLLLTATVLIIVLGVLWISTPPNQLPGGAPSVSDDETSR